MDFISPSWSSVDHPNCILPFILCRVTSTDAISSLMLASLSSFSDLGSSTFLDKKLLIVRDMSFVDFRSLVDSVVTILLTLAGLVSVDRLGLIGT